MFIGQGCRPLQEITVCFVRAFPVHNNLPLFCHDVQQGLLFQVPGGFAPFRMKRMENPVSFFRRFAGNQHRIHEKHSLTVGAAVNLFFTGQRLFFNVVGKLHFGLPVAFHEFVNAVQCSISFSGNQLRPDSEGVDWRRLVLQQAELLRQSILKKAFESKLVAQDPNDEPASVLLDRIKAEREKNKPIEKLRLNKKIAI